MNARVVMDHLVAAIAHCRNASARTQAMVRRAIAQFRAWVEAGALIARAK